MVVSSERQPLRTVSLDSSGVSDEQCQTLPPSLSLDSDSEEDEEGSKNNDVNRDCTDVPKRSAIRTLLRCFGTAFMIWLIEFNVVVGLKYFGVVDPRFTVAENVMPQFDTWLNISMSMSSLPYLSQLEGALSDMDPFTYLTHEKKRPGYRLRQQGARPEYPVVMIPGFVTSGLEVWNGKECAKQHFRRRLWAALIGARSFFTDRDCWREHMALDPFTGGDPDGIRLRAAQGFEAADYFMVNYWVFGKLIENLADLGYTSSDASMEPYDWRLSFEKLEERDGYLTHLRHKIEAMHSISGKKVVLTSHSMGSLLVHHFFAWVTTPKRRGGGGGGKDWVNRHVHTYVNIAGPHLGVPKAATALLSGEMSDTILGGAAGNVMEQFFGKQKRRDLWSTWGSLWLMLPTGGDNLWGSGADFCSERSQHDPFCRGTKTIPLISVSDRFESVREASVGRSVLNPTLQTLFTTFKEKRNHTTAEVVDFVRSFGATHGTRLANSKILTGNQWYDPTKTPLPHAPDMKIFCLYGTGIPTERAYHYRQNSDTHGAEAGLPLVLDNSVDDKDRRTSQGVRYGNGDGSVPLLSLGYMCADAWQRKETQLNPSKIPVYTREYVHKPEFTVDDPMRNGPRSADHVDILGHEDLMEDLLRIVSDFEVAHVQNNRLESDILEVATKINAHPNGGIQKQARRWFR